MSGLDLLTKVSRVMLSVPRLVTSPVLRRISLPAYARNAFLAPDHIKRLGAFFVLVQTARCDF
jgi:hypothetical protein